MDNERAKALKALADQRWRLAMWLTGAMMFIYFGFILLIAYNKPLLGSLVIPGLSLGILLGALVITHLHFGLWSDGVGWARCHQAD